MLVDAQTSTSRPAAPRSSPRRRAARRSSSSCPPRSSRSLDARRPRRSRTRSPSSAARAGALAEAARAWRLDRPPPAHPFAAAEGALNAGERYAAHRAEYGRRRPPPAASRHCTSTSRSAAPTARSRSTTRCAHLPELAALAAGAPFYEGRDTGLASVRPLVGGLLPRQGIPPALDELGGVRGTSSLGPASGGARAAPLVVGAAAPRVHGTLEVRVPDVQPTLAEAAGVAGFVARARGLARRAPRRGRALGAPAEQWRIEREPLGGAAPRRSTAARRRRDGRRRRCATGSTTARRARACVRPGRVLEGARRGGRSAPRGLRRATSGRQPPGCAGRFLEAVRG